MGQKGAIITGGAKRIGRAIAIELAKEGYDIALHYNRSKNEALEVRDLIRKVGRRSEIFHLDLLNVEKFPSFMREIQAFNRDCLVLINNASIFEKARFLGTDFDLFERHININFRAPFFMTQQFASIFQTGTIINILDTKVARTLIEYFAYTLSKKALTEFTKMAAKELAPEYRVNGVGPGLILPPEGESEEYLKKLSEKIPLKKRGYPDDVISAVKFLINHQYITGECLFIDGGEHLK